MTGIRKNLKENDGLWFGLTIGLMIVEYGRPMDIMPVLNYVRPGMVLGILLAVSLLGGSRLTRSLVKQTGVITAFVLLLFLYTPFAVNNRYAFNQAWSMTLYLPAVFSIVAYVRNVQRLRTFLNVWLLIGIYVALRGTLEKGSGGSSFLHDENDFSLFMNMMIPFMVFRAYEVKGIGEKCLFLIGGAICVLGVVVSFSRGGFIGLLAVLFIIWLFSPRKVLSLGIVAMLTLVIIFSADQKYWQEMTTIEDITESTSQERLNSWKAAWEMFKDNPLGVGGGNFPVRFPEYQPEDMPRGMWGRVAHSLWFTLISELGIPGTIIYFLLLFNNFRDIFWIKKFRKNGDEDMRLAYFLSLAFIGSFAGFFVSGIFLSILYYPHYFYLTAMIVVTRRLAAKKKEHVQKECGI